MFSPSEQLLTTAFANLISSIHSMYPSHHKLCAFIQLVMFASVYSDFSSFLLCLPVDHLLFCFYKKSLWAPSSSTFLASLNRLYSTTTRGYFILQYRMKSTYVSVSFHKLCACFFIWLSLYFLRLYSQPNFSCLTLQSSYHFLQLLFRSCIDIHTIGIC